MDHSCAGFIVRSGQPPMAAALATALFDEQHIRTRAILIAYYRSGTGKAPFIHAQLRIHSGRAAASRNPAG